MAMSFARRAFGLLLAGLGVLACVSSASAQGAYVENSLKNGGHSTQHVIITIAPGHENEVLATLQRHGDRVTSQHPSINGVAASIHGDDLDDLAQHGAVAITSDSIVHLTASPVASKASTPM